MSKHIFRGGFTLLELLIVVSILAILGGALLTAYQNVDEDAARKVAQHEMLKVKDAILRFKQDTGYLPRQGPFDLAPPDQCDPLNTNGVVPLPSQGKAWFCSPANFVELHDNPLTGTTHPLRNWNPDTGRGWRGPYLTRGGEGLVDIGDELLADGTGCPTHVVVVLLTNVRGVADPFLTGPSVFDIPPFGIPPVCRYDACTNPSQASCVLDWRTTSADETHIRWGRPYLMFDLNNEKARIVSMGPDGIYAGVNALDPCSPPPNADDLVLCLLK